MGVVNPNASCFYQALDSHALAQENKGPPRKEHILDLLITNKPGLIKSSYSVPRNSDRCVVVIELTHPTTIQNPA